MLANEGPPRVNVGAFTVSVAVVVAVSVPDVPVIVTVFVPRAAVLLLVKVRVLELAVGLGENVAVTPLGNPDAERVTLPLNPYAGLIETFEVAVVPCPIFTEDQ